MTKKALELGQKGLGTVCGWYNPISFPTRDLLLFRRYASQEKTHNVQSIRLCSTHRAKNLLDSRSEGHAGL